MADAAAETPEQRPSTLALLLPWLAAPLFCLLPIGGCAVANSMRHGPAQSVESPTATPPLMAVSLPR